MNKYQETALMLMIFGLWIAIGGLVEGAFGILMYTIGGILLLLGAYLSKD